MYGNNLAQQNALLNIAAQAQATNERKAQAKQGMGMFAGEIIMMNLIKDPSLKTQIELKIPYASLDEDDLPASISSQLKNRIIADNQRLNGFVNAIINNQHFVEVAEQIALTIDLQAGIPSSEFNYRNFEANINEDLYQNNGANLANIKQRAKNYLDGLSNLSRANDAQDWQAISGKRVQEINNYAELKYSVDGKIVDAVSGPGLLVMASSIALAEMDELNQMQHLMMMANLIGNMNLGARR